MIYNAETTKPDIFHELQSINITISKNKLVIKIYNEAIESNPGHEKIVKYHHPPTCTSTKPWEKSHKFSLEN